MEGHWRITERDSPRPSTIQFLRALSSEISGVLQFARHPPHAVPAHAFPRPRALLQRVRERNEPNLSVVGFCDQPIRNRTGVDLRPRIIDQSA